MLEAYNTLRERLVTEGFDQALSFVDRLSAVNPR
jgi:hypothetical protein